MLTTRDWWKLAIENSDDIKSSDLKEAIVALNDYLVDRFDYKEVVAELKTITNKYLEEVEGMALDQKFRYEGEEASQEDEVKGERSPLLEAGTPVDVLTARLEKRKKLYVEKAKELIGETKSPRFITLAFAVVFAAIGAAIGYLASWWSGPLAVPVATTSAGYGAVIGAGVGTMAGCLFTRSRVLPVANAGQEMAEKIVKAQYDAYF